MLDVTALQVDALGMVIYIEATEPGGERRDFAFGDREGECEEVDKVFYVHPNSLHLLEAQLGDRDDDGFTYAATNDWRRPDSTGCSVRSPKVCRTAKRNGIAFHWPESEAA